MKNRFAEHAKTQQIVTGTTVTADKFYETHNNIEVLKSGKQSKTFLTTASFNQELDLSMLPMAAESYHLSPNVEDYLVIPIPIVTVSYPNRNLEAFPLEEVTYFDPRHGMPVYKTFNMKPVFKDHLNMDPTKALGLHVDSTMVYVPKFDVWKIVVLTMWDRTKDVQRISDIMSKKITGYSMGAFVDSFTCSICGAMDVNIKPCEHHVGGAGRTYGPTNRMAYKVLLGAAFFETSSVASPADDSAFSEDVYV